MFAKCSLTCFELRCTKHILQFMSNLNIWASFSGDPHGILHQRRPFWNPNWGYLILVMGITKSLRNEPHWFRFQSILYGDVFGKRKCQRLVCTKNIMYGLICYVINNIIIKMPLCCKLNAVIWGGSMALWDKPIPASRAKSRPILSKLIPLYLLQAKCIVFVSIVASNFCYRLSQEMCRYINRNFMINNYRVSCHTNIYLYTYVYLVILIYDSSLFIVGPVAIKQWWGYTYYGWYCCPCSQGVR